MQKNLASDNNKVIVNFSWRDSILLTSAMVQAANRANT